MQKHHYLFHRNCDLWLQPVHTCSQSCTALLPTTKVMSLFGPLKGQPSHWAQQSCLCSIQEEEVIGYLVFTLFSNSLSCVDLIATLGETTATPYFVCRLRDAMLAHPTGRRILRERPRITSRLLSMAYLRTLPRNSLGRTYVSWLDREGVSPDTRAIVKYVDDEECAYVMQRYRECHDFYHAITGLPVMVEGEIALKAFEFANTLLPMTGLSIFAVSRLRLAQRERFFSIYFPWALKNGIRCQEIINIYWEEELYTDVDDLRTNLGLTPAPDLRKARKAKNR